MKKYKMSFLAIALAISASAFTGIYKKASYSGNNYTYDLYGQPHQDEAVNLNNPENYTLIGTAPLFCSGAAHRCGVENATDDGTNHPDFSQSFTIKTRN